MLADLVRAGLASVMSERKRAVGRVVLVVRVRITGAGRRALEG
jgi:hypothetical protein